MHRFHEMAPAQKCFYFIHPNVASYPPYPTQIQQEQMENNKDGKTKQILTTTTTTASTSTTTTPLNPPTGASSGLTRGIGKKVSRASSSPKPSGNKASKRQRGNDEYEEKENKNISIPSISDSIINGSTTAMGPLGYGEKVIDNNRYTQMTFPIQTANILYGFAGYFESCLYKDISISIYPPTYSTGMFSWFPLYFPIQAPVYIPKNTQIKVHFWRNVSEEQHKVWYEWSFEDCNKNSGISSLIHNPNGRSSSIRF